MSTVEFHSRVMDAARGAMKGAIRRMVVSKAAVGLWQLAGIRIYGKVETFEAEQFGGIGLYALPPTDGVPEAVVVMTGDANAPVIVATQDEKTRAAVMPAGFAAGETVLYSVASLLYLKDGRIEARTPSGTAKQLVTLDDLNALIDWIKVHHHTSATAGSPTTPPLFSGTGSPVPVPQGTQVFHGE
jgi:phage gp45-like